jgi:type IV secretory pathway TrbL component
MTGSLAIDSAVALLFALMAFRTFRSGSNMDYLLGALQCVGLLLLLLSNYRLLASFLLLVTALIYLLSQVITGARPISSIPKPLTR